MVAGAANGGSPAKGIVAGNGSRPKVVAKAGKYFWWLGRGQITSKNVVVGSVSCRCFVIIDDPKLVHFYDSEPNHSVNEQTDSPKDEPEAPVCIVQAPASCLA